MTSRGVRNLAHIDTPTFKTCRYPQLEGNCTVTIPFKQVKSKESQTLGMDNVNLFFHLSEIQEKIACEFFGLINAIFILVMNEKVLGKGINDY